MPLPYDLKLLGYVLAIAEEGSVSAAARRLRLSQPTLSRQVRELERRLGVELFARAGQGVAATAAGEAFVRRGARVLAEAESLTEDVQLAAQGRTGRLAIAFAGSGINGPLGVALRRVRVELPDVDLRLVEVFDDVEMSEGVLDGSFDVAIQRLPVHDARLSAQMWSREPLSLFLPAGHPLAGRDPIPVAALRDLPLILWPRESSPRAYDEVIALFHRADLVPHVAAVGRTVQTILALVAAGFGGAVMADSYRVLGRQGVVAVRLAGAATTLHLVWRADDRRPLLTQLATILKTTRRDGAPQTT
jgi:DNA-binding transcriptional LysR family regulator